MYYVMADTITEKEIGCYKCGFRVLGGEGATVEDMFVLW
jgi:DNA-directed RNA polymerase subunit RPC12/RpoP